MIPALLTMVIQEARDCLDSLWGEPWPRWRAPQALAAAEERTDNASLLLHCALYLDVLGSRKDQIIPMIRFISAADPPSLLSRDSMPGSTALATPLRLAIHLGCSKAACLACCPRSLPATWQIASGDPDISPLDLLQQLNDDLRIMMGRPEHHAKYRELYTIISGYQSAHREAERAPIARETPHECSLRLAREQQQRQAVAEAERQAKQRAKEEARRLDRVKRQDEEQRVRQLERHAQLEYEAAVKEAEHVLDGVLQAVQHCGTPELVTTAMTEVVRVHSRGGFC